MPVSFSKRCWHWRRKAAFAVSEDLLFPMWILEFTEAPQQGAALRVSEHFDGSKATRAAQEVVRYFAGRSIELLRCSEPVYSHRLAVAFFLDAVQVPPTVGGSTTQEIQVVYRSSD